MKRSVEGKRLSKRERLEFSTWVEFVEYQQAMTHVGAHAQMALDVEAARAGLLARGLPADIVVTDDTGMRRIDVFMTDRGFTRDTPEDLFARMIVAWDRLASAEDRLDVIQQTFLFAEARTLAAAYLLESATRSKQGKLGAEKTWAGKRPLSEIVEALAKRKDCLGGPLEPSELWPMLYGNLDDAGLQPHECGKSYKYDGGKEVTFEAFRKAIQRARQKPIQSARKR